MFIFFSGSSSNSSSRKMSNKDNKENSKENIRLRHSYDDTIGSLPSNFNVSGHSLSDKSADKKSCGPLYRMYTDTLPHVTSLRDVDVERNTPKWRFFVKRLSPSYIILTFIPASYQDCKALMLPKACNILSESNPVTEELQQTEDEKQIVLESKLNPEAKPFLPVSSVKDNINSPSPLSSRGWILHNLESTTTDFDQMPSISDEQNNSNWELNKGTLDPSSPFRLRARSWEPMKPQSVLKTKKLETPRERTQSVGSRGKLMSENKLSRKLLDDSDVNPSTTKMVLGSLNIPVYVYGCSMDSMMDALILKSEYVDDCKDLYWTKACDLNREDEFESDNIFGDIEEVLSEDTLDNSSFKQG